MDGIHAMDNGGLEVDIENAEHVDGVQGDAERHQPRLPPPAPPPASGSAGCAHFSDSL